MATTSSLSGTVPHFYCPSIGSHRRPTRRGSSVSLPASAAFTAIPPSLRSSRSKAFYPVLHHRSVINGGVQRRNSIGVTGMHVSGLRGREASRCLCCFRGLGTGRGNRLPNLTRFRPAALSALNPLTRSPHRLFGSTIIPPVKRGDVLCANVGPDEPHVTSQTWQDADIAAVDLDGMGESEIRVEDLLDYQLPLEGEAGYQDQEPQLEIDPRRMEERFAVLNTGVYECRSCGYLYDQAKGDPSYPIAPGLDFFSLPSDWRCPTCGAAQSFFDSKSVEIAGFAQNQQFGLGGNSLTSGQKTLLIYGSLLLFFGLFLSGYFLQ